MRTSKEIREAVECEDFNWLGRFQFISDFIEVLLEENHSTHYCMNGIWGSGKTTLVLGMIKTIEELEKNKPMYLYIDAWEYEHYGHPFFALLKSIEIQIPELFEKVKSKFKENNKSLQFGLSFFGVNLDLVNESTRILNEAEYIDELNMALNEAVKIIKEEKNNKLIIFIDELDRAKPSFALNMIEMFHHLEDVLPTHVVYSVDLSQLNGIIKHYYGYDYNVEIFTHKTFDTVISVPKIEVKTLKEFIKNKIDSSNRPKLNNIPSYLMKYMTDDHINSLRTINRLIERIEIDSEKPYFSNPSIDWDFFLGESFRWNYQELMVAFNVFYINNPVEVKGFKHGKNLDIFKNFLMDSEKITSSSKIWDLIRESSNYNKNEDLKIKSNDELNKSLIIEGLKNIFNPPGNKSSVFNI